MLANPSSTQPFSRPMKHRVTVAALGLGITVPFIYCGTQIVAAPYFADYSFVRQPASLLGSDNSTNPAIFNFGVMATGTATLISALGFFFALRRDWCQSVSERAHLRGPSRECDFEPVGGQLPNARPKAWRPSRLSRPYAFATFFVDCYALEGTQRAPTQGLPDRDDHPPDCDGPDHVRQHQPR